MDENVSCVPSAKYCTRFRDFINGSVEGNWTHIINALIFWYFSYNQLDNIDIIVIMINVLDQQYHLRFIMKELKSLWFIMISLVQVGWQL